MSAKPGPGLGTLCTTADDEFMIWLSLGPLLEMKDVHPLGSTTSSAPVQSFQRSGNVMQLPQITGWRVGAHAAWLGTPPDARDEMLRNIRSVAGLGAPTSRGCVC